jgi:hypothetical protein
MRRNSKKVISILVVIIILCVVLAGVFLYFTTDMFKSNKQLFLKYLAQNIEVAEQYLEDPNKEEMDTLKSSPYTVDSTINFNLESEDSEIADQTTPPRNFSIAYTKSADPQKDTDYSEAKIKYLTKELFSVQYVRDGDIHVVNGYNSINESNIFNVYLGIENNNLKQLAQKLGIEDTTNIPNKIQSISLSDLLSLTDIEKEYIQNALLNVVNNQISDTNFYNKKGVTIEIESKQVNTNLYGITLSSTEYKNFVITLLNEVSQDDEILNVILNKIMMLDSETEITIATLRKQIQNYIMQISAEEFEDGIKLEVYESNGKIVRLNIEKNSTDYYIIDYERGDNAIRTIVTMNYTYDATTNEGNDESNTNVTFTEDGYQIIEGSSLGQGTTTEQENSTYTITRLEFAKQITGNQKNAIAIATIETNNNTVTLSIQNKTDKSTTQDGYTNNITVKINSSDTTFFTININSNIESASSVSVPTLTQSNYAVLNNRTQENIVQLLSAIGVQLTNIYEQQIEVVKQVQEQEDAQNSGLTQINTDMLEMNTITDRDVIN